MYHSEDFCWLAYDRPQQSSRRGCEHLECLHYSKHNEFYQQYVILFFFVDRNQSPVFNPKPPAGGNRWAASPTRKTFPAGLEKEAATSACIVQLLTE